MKTVSVNKTYVLLARAVGLQSVAVRRSTGNDMCDHFFRRCCFISFSLSSTFLIEGVLGSKNLFSESGSKWAIT